MDESAAANARKKGTAELLVLAQLEAEPSHGYQIAQSISERSDGVVSFQVTSLYPILYGLEARGMIAAKWVEQSGKRRRRYYRLTPKGRRALSAERKSWACFMAAIQKASGPGYA